MIIVYNFLTRRKKSSSSKKKKKRTKVEIISEVSPIAAFVRQRRETLGYTQEELAFRVGISPGFLKAFERGKKTVRLNKVTDLLGYFEATLIVKTRDENA